MRYTKERYCFQLSLINGFIYLLIITTRSCGEKIKIKPNISLSRYEKNYICSADGNYTSLPLVFVTSQNKYINKKTNSTYRNLGNDFNCDFEDNSTCIRLFKNSKWTLSKAGDHEINPVIDERWEEFAIRKAGMDSIYEKIQVNNPNYVIAISVNSYEQPQIVLCDAMSNHTQCVWITINEIEKNIDKNDIGIILRKCSELSLDPFSNEDCKRYSTMHINEQTKPSWIHFLIYKQDDYMVFEETNREDTLIGYRERIPLNGFVPKFALTNIFFKNAEWKEHTYKYLAFTTNNTSVQFGPAYKSKSSGSLCISLYIAMCVTCELLIKDNSNNIINIFQNDLEIIRPTWKNIKFEVQVQKDVEYRFYMLGINKNDKQKSFWAIDNIRLCHDNEVREVTLNSNEELSNISCQALGYSNWKSTLEGTYETGSNTIENITMDWINNKLHLTWMYLNTYKLDAKFNIKIKQISTELENVNNFIPINKLFNSDNKQEYSYTIDDNFPHSSSYLLTICVKENCSLNEQINTAPTKPIFMDSISIENMNVDNIVNLTIPGVDFTTTSQHSYIYVVVCEKFEDATRDTNDINREKLYLLVNQNMNCSGASWIAGELEVTNKTSYFLVGDEATLYSNNFINPLVNKPLNASKTYSYNVVVMNIYKDEFAFSSQTTETEMNQEKESNNIYYLLCLILIIFISSIIWALKNYNIIRICKKQEHNANPTRSEIPDTTNTTSFPTDASTVRHHEDEAEAMLHTPPVALAPNQTV